VVYGNSHTVIYGNAVLNPITPTYTHIYVVFPPQSGINNTNLKSNVMKQAAIDGVTVVVPVGGGLPVGGALPVTCVGELCDKISIPLITALSIPAVSWIVIIPLVAVTVNGLSNA